MSLHDLLHQQPATHAASSPDAAAQSASAVSHSDTVLTLDRWGRLRGEWLVRDWRLAGMWIRGSNAEAALVAGDIHELLFSPQPVWEPHPSDEVRARWLREFAATGDYAGIRELTVLRPEIAAVASAAVARSYWRFLEERERRQQQQQGSQSQPESQPSDDDSGDLSQIMQSTGQAARKAAKDAELMAKVGLLAGTEPGEAIYLGQARLAQVFSRIRDSRLRSIIEWAGKAIALAQALQARKQHAEAGELHAVMRDGSIERLLPSELADLCGAAGPERELLALHRVATRQAMCWRLRRRRPTGRGPIIVSVDESSSMFNGTPERIVVAKAIALAMAWVARHQHRWCAMVSWAATDRVKHLVLPFGRSADVAALIDWACSALLGGTLAVGPLRRVPELHAEWLSQGLPRGQADHIIITDGDVHGVGDHEESYRDWAAAHQVRTYLISVACGPGEMESVVDRHWTVAELGLDEAAVQEVMSI